MAFFLTLILSSITALAAYPLKSGSEINTYPSPLKSIDSREYSTIHFYAPGWMRANMTCSGGVGSIYVKDILLNRTLLEEPINNQLTLKFSLPHAGVYEVHFKGSGTPTCAVVMRDVHAPLGTQRFYYSLGIVSSLILSALLIRG